MDETKSGSPSTVVMCPACHRVKGPQATAWHEASPDEASDHAVAQDWGRDKHCEPCQRLVDLIWCVSCDLVQDGKSKRWRRPTPREVEKTALLGIEKKEGACARHQQAVSANLTWCADCDLVMDEDSARWRMSTEEERSNAAISGNKEVGNCPRHAPRYQDGGSGT